MAESHKVELNLPAGMTGEDLLKVLKSYQDRQVHTQAYNKARRTALNELAKKHAPEFKVLFEAAKKAVKVSG
jgi:hypothetical protein